MPRRYADYSSFSNVDTFEYLHFISTCFSYLNALGYSLVLVNLGYGAVKGVKAPANPYNALGLEWQTPSPPPHDNFETIPVVTDWSYGYGEEYSDHDQSGNKKIVAKPA